MNVAAMPRADAQVPDNAATVRLTSGESRVWAHLLEGTGRVWAAAVALGQGDALVELRDRWRPYPLIGACRTVADCEVALRVLAGPTATGECGETSGVVLPRSVAAAPGSWRAPAARYPAAPPPGSPDCSSDSPLLPSARTATQTHLLRHLRPTPPPRSPTRNRSRPPWPVCAWEPGSRSVGWPASWASPDPPSPRPSVAAGPDRRPLSFCAGPRPGYARTGTRSSLWKERADDPRPYPGRGTFRPGQLGCARRGAGAECGRGRRAYPVAPVVPGRTAPKSVPRRRLPPRHTPAGARRAPVRNPR